jgi:hypothetical protein
LVFRDPTMIAQWPWRGRARPWRGLRGWGRSLGVSGGWQVRTRVAIGPTAFPYFAGFAHARNFIALLRTILGGAVALAIIASIDALLCAKLVRRPASGAATAIGS